jgi:hypothetical protein
MTPAQFFADNPAALECYHLIEAAQIPDEEMTPDPYDRRFETPEGNRELIALERAHDAVMAQRRTAIRDVAAVIAKTWPHRQTRGDLWLELVGYAEGKPALYRTITAVFDAAREEAAALNLQETT